MSLFPFFEFMILNSWENEIKNGFRCKTDYPSQTVRSHEQDDRQEGSREQCPEEDSLGFFRVAHAAQAND